MATATKKQSAPKKPTPSKRPSDVEIVRASAANPAASRAGTTHVLATAELEGVSVEIIDGARAVVEVEKQTFNQANLHTLQKVVNQAIQETY